MRRPLPFLAIACLLAAGLTSASHAASEENRLSSTGSTDAFMNMKPHPLSRIGETPEDGMPARPPAIRSTVQTIPTPEPGSGTLLRPLKISLTEKGLPVKPIHLPPGTSVPISKWKNNSALIRHASGEHWLSCETQWETQKLGSLPSSTDEITDDSIQIIEMDVDAAEADTVIRNAFEGSNAPAVRVINRSEKAPLVVESLGPNFLAVQELPIQRVLTAGPDEQGNLLVYGTFADGTPGLVRRLQAAQIAPSLTQDGLLRLSENTLTDSSIQPANPRQISDVLKRNTIEPLVDDDFQTSEQGWFFRDSLRSHFRDGKLILKGDNGGAWASKHIAFNDFACEVVARVTNGKHRGWGMVIYGPYHTEVDAETPHQGIEVLLDGDGNLRIIPDRWNDKNNPKRIEIAPIGPTSVPNFQADEFNSLTAIFTNNNQLAVFVNGVEALPPIELPFRLDPAWLQIASAGGEQSETTLEFDSFRVFAAPDVDLRPSNPAIAVEHDHPDDEATIAEPAATVAEFQPRALSEIFDRTSVEPLLADDFTDPQNRRFLSRPTKEMHYRDAKLVVEPGHLMALPDRQIALKNFAAEMVARANFETHRCWAVGIHGEVGPPGNRNNPQYTLRITLASEGNLRIFSDLPSEQGVEDSGWPNIGPVPVRNFLPNEFNTLTVLFTEGYKVAVFVNDIEAIEPLSIPVRLEPAAVRFLSCAASGGTVEFDSFRIFYEMPTENTSSH